MCVGRIKKGVVNPLGILEYGCKRPAVLPEKFCDGFKRPAVLSGKFYGGCKRPTVLSGKFCMGVRDPRCIQNVLYGCERPAVYSKSSVWV